MKEFIVKNNIWFGGKFYHTNEIAQFDPNDPEVIKVVEAGHLEVINADLKIDTKLNKKGKSK